MTHYDDLQRFKDKTQTQTIAFKDMSAQRHAHEQGNWAILNQLAPQEENPALSGAGHVSRGVEAVAPGAFKAAAPAASAAPAVSAPVNVDSTAPALLREVAQQLPTAAPQHIAEAPAPVVFAPEPPPAASAPVYAAAQPPVNAPAPVAVKPTAPAVAQVAPKTAEAVNYAQLFAPKAPEAPRSEEKDQPLQGLFERIASCR